MRKWRGRSYKTKPDRVLAVCRICNHADKYEYNSFFHAARVRCNRCGGVVDRAAKQRLDVPTYRERDELLKALGYSSYDVYLASTLWESIKTRAFAKHGRSCFICRKPATVVHHIGYGRDTLLGENLETLAPLCGGCHLRVEKNNKGKKRTLVQAQSAYRSMTAVRGTRRHCSKCGGRCKRGYSICRACARKSRESFNVSEAQQTTPPRRILCKCGGTPRQGGHLCSLCEKRVLTSITADLLERLRAREVNQV